MRPQAIMPPAGGSHAPSTRGQIPAWKRGIGLMWFIAFVACLGAGAFLGLSRHGQPLMPSALSLWAPAGVLLIVPGLAIMAGRLQLATPGPDRLRGALTTVFGLGLLGVGLAHIAHRAGFYRLAVPALVLAEIYLVREVVRGPSGATFDRVYRRRGRARMWLAYVGAIMLVLAGPVMIVAALGFIDLART
jgi:hypothetical protein